MGMGVHSVDTDRHQHHGERQSQRTDLRLTVYRCRDGEPGPRSHSGWCSLPPSRVPGKDCPGLEL